MKIAVLVSGSGSNLQVLIDQLHRDTTCDIEISVVISDKRTAYALTRARQANIPTHVVRLRDHPDRNSFDAEISRVIDEYEAELIVLAGFMKVLQPQFVQKYRNCIINIHPSLLPAFPGAHPLSDALAYGVKVSGATVHFVDEGLDTGPIIAQVSVPVYESDNEESLHARIQIEEYKIYPQVVKLCAEGKLEISSRKVTVKET